ncbi:MAG: hypothetical protein K2Y08_01920 [Alphaproteobacteria bacterium]|nr:hypothetical protein [Alphaproteobacteria bacterium]
MFGKKVFLALNLFILFNTYSYAGWPEEGWEGVSGLRLIHKERTVNFDELHQHLAIEEEKTARILPSNTPTNIVLASISLLGGGETSSPHTYHLKSQDGKWFVFESGWTSSFIPHPIYDQAQKLMRPYASKLQKDEMTLDDREQLVRDCIRVAGDQSYFEEQIQPSFYFFNQEPLPVSRILERAERVFFEVDPKEASYSIYQELRKDRAAFDRLLSSVQAIKIEAGRGISEILSRNADLSSGVSFEFIKELASTSKNYQDTIFKREKEVSSIGSKVISTYWHSEQKLLKYIEDEMPNILADILKEPLPFIPEAIVINVHSRHDICPVCSHAFVRSMRPEGILSTFRDALCKRLEIDSQTFPLYMTSSFREKREKTKYVIRDDLPGILEDSITATAPAFPTLYIPLSSHAHSPLPSSSSSSSSSSSGSSGSR